MQEFNWMKSSWRVKSIGPTLPSTYVDNRIPSDSHYGFNLHTPDSQPYLNWLTSKPHASVIYVSFGSMASLSVDQTKELASALINTRYSFLWVVRASELAKLPENFVQETVGRGLVVTWCSQLDVLAHNAVGCFLTHCGWNSTVEGITLGVPMVGMPQWTDQPTDAKYIEDVWGIGVRVKVEDESGIVRSDELERGIREVMEGERSKEIRRNVAKWKELAKGAVSVGGSSDKNIVEFIAECCM